MKVAITRAVSARIDRCELSYQAREAIDVARAREQHRRYEDCLAACGYTVQRLAEEPDLPDAVFVEDTAIVLDELAVITRPGAESRRAETGSVAAALQPFRRLCHIEPPGTLDGGDVLPFGRTLYIGRSRRTNQAAVAQLCDLLGTYGYEVKAVQVRRCLHLKSAVTSVAADVLLINPDWIDEDAFPAVMKIAVDPGEPAAANALLLDDGVVFPAAHPATRRRLENYGLRVHAVEVSELAKAEGGVTCCSLIVPD